MQKHSQKQTEESAGRAAAHAATQRKQGAARRPPLAANGPAPEGSQGPLQLRPPAQAQLPVQRIVFDESADVLHTAADWADTENGDGKTIAEALNHGKTKFEDADLFASLTDRWEINPYSTTLEVSGPDALADAFMAYHAMDDVGWRGVKSLVDIISAKTPENRRDTVRGRLAKQGKDDLLATYGKIPGIQAVYNSFTANVKAILLRKLTPTVQPPLYLYKLTGSDLDESAESATTWVNGLSLVPKTLLHPMAYKDPDTDTDVDFDADLGEGPTEEKRTKVCVLISMIYERALSAGNALTAKEAIRLLFVDLGLPNFPAGEIRPDAANKMMPKDDNLYVRLIPQLHNHLKGQGLFYDLEKYNEQVLEKSYNRIVSTNCSWASLPANIPQGLTLAQNETFVFLIKGHATTVKMKQAVAGQMGVPDPAELEPDDVFAVFNETSENFNGESFDFNVESIWRKS